MTTRATSRPAPQNVVRRRSMTEQQSMSAWKRFAYRIRKLLLLDMSLQEALAWIFPASTILDVCKARLPQLQPAGKQVVSTPSSRPSRVINGEGVFEELMPSMGKVRYPLTRDTCPHAKLTGRANKQG
eukprot:2199847-Amphidinium_carterae.1